MDPCAIQAIIAKRFCSTVASSFVGRVGFSKIAVPITHLRSTEARVIETKTVPFEQSFSLQVPLEAPYRWWAWFSGKEKIVPPAMPGNAYLFDLTVNPRVRLNSAFSSVRFNISQNALAEYAYEHGMRDPRGLRAKSMDHPDPIMSNLAQLIVCAMARTRESTGLFVDWVTLAFCAHALANYGGVPAQPTIGRTGLTPWQLRRACEAMESDLGGHRSISDIATECGLSSGYFAKAFRQAVGMPPHAWLSKRRIERSKALLAENGLPLSEIAIRCGFVDQSHFSRTFAKHEGCSPGKWRRYHRAS